MELLYKFFYEYFFIHRMRSSSSKEKTTNNQAKEVAIHGDPIPEGISKKLYNSIVRIKFTNINKDSLSATGFL